MRFWCLTSLTLKQFDENDLKFSPSHVSPHADLFYEEAKFLVIRQNLLNATNYELSEIRTGKNKDEFYFVLCRQGVKYFNIRMERGALMVSPRRNEESAIIDISINHEKLSVQRFPEKYIENIRIRAIKVTSNKYQITTTERKTYNEYAKRINELSNYNPENHENSFREIGPILLPNQSIPKAVNQKITDIYGIFNNVCDPISNDSENMLPTARYYSGLYDYEEMNFHPGHYDPRFELTKDFADCRLLIYNSINLTEVNERWFLAEGLLSLTFRNIILFQEIRLSNGEIKQAEAWKIFAKNIGKFKHLTVLQMCHCRITEIPDDVFQELPTTIKCLVLSQNYLIKISPLISRLVNLQKLRLNYNSKLTEDGIPWNDIPETLSYLDLDGTYVAKIPKEVERFKFLKYLNVQTFILQEIDWDALTDDIEKLLISGSSGVDTNKPYRKKINNAVRDRKARWDLEKTTVPLNTQELKSTHNNLHECNADFSQLPFSHLTILDLSNNKLKSIPWASLPPTLEVIEFANNKIEIVESIYHLTNLERLSLYNNKIHTITGTFTYRPKFRSINLNNNKELSALPEGFEKLQHLLFLNLSDTGFCYKKENLKTALWNRLPATNFLFLNGINLFELPCQLAGKVENIKAIGCNLHYICPQIYNRLYEYINTPSHIGRNLIKLNISKNDAIKTLSFVPHFIWPIAAAAEIARPFVDYIPDESELGFRKCANFPEWSIIYSDKATLRKTQRFPVNGKKPVYSFRKVTETEEEKKTNCKCCAYCKHEESKNKEVMMIEQLMMMGCTFSVTEKPQKKRTERVKIQHKTCRIKVKNPDLKDIALKVKNKAIGIMPPNSSEYHKKGKIGWPTKTWKTLVRTRLCQICIDKLKEKAEMAYKTSVSDKPEQKRQRTKITEAIVEEPEFEDNTMINSEIHIMLPPTTTVPCTNVVHKRPHVRSNMPPHLESSSTPFPSNIEPRMFHTQQRADYLIYCEPQNNRITSGHDVMLSAPQPQNWSMSYVSYVEPNNFQTHQNIVNLDMINTNANLLNPIYSEPQNSQSVENDWMLPTSSVERPSMSDPSYAEPYNSHTQQYIDNFRLENSNTNPMNAIPVYCEPPTNQTASENDWMLPPYNNYFTNEEESVQNIHELTWIFWNIEPQIIADWPYHYPSFEELTAICNYHKLLFNYYPYCNCEIYYNSNIFNKPNLLTVQICQEISSGFQALAFLITGNKNNWPQLQNLIIDHINNPNQLLPPKFYTLFHMPETDLFSHSIKVYHIYAAAHLLQLNVLVFNYYNDGKWFLFNESYFESVEMFTNFFGHRSSILLSKDSNNHFNPVLAADLHHL